MNIRTRASGLTRISHQSSTAAEDALCPAGFSLIGVLNRLSSMPPRSSGRKHHWTQHLSALATNSGEKRGLGSLAVVLMIILSGCVSSPFMEPLEVTLANIEIEGMTLVETTLVADVRIVNPNPDSLNFNGASCKLYLGGGKVGTGVTSESFVVDRLSTHNVKIAFHINNAAAIFRLHQIRVEKVVNYKLRTVLFSDGAFGTTKYKTVYEGVLDLTRDEDSENLESLE